MSEPLLPHLLIALYEQGVNNLFVIADEKQPTVKDKRIWTERTRGAFDLVEIGIYDFAAQLLPFYLVKHHNSEGCLSLLRKLRPTVLINGGTPRKLATPILEIPKQGLINVHPGVLPKYRGSCCVEWAILNDDPVGLTAHFMTEGYDEGPIIEIEMCSFALDDDYVDIRVQVYRRWITIMARTVANILRTGMMPVDAVQQGDGSFFRPVSEAQMQQVISKVQSHSYLYMGL